jgi:hypothetical protein
VITVDYEGEYGNLDHITRNQTGHVPTAAIASLLGVRGEQPGQHRNRQGGERWEDFKRDVVKSGFRPIFITVDFRQQPRISEGNHRRDAAVELGMTEVPVEVRYFGHAERLLSLSDEGEWVPLPFAQNGQPWDIPPIEREEGIHL